MAKFNLKEHIAKNKATFFGSLTEGQFSWMTQDTGQQIGSQDENKIPVYMFDNNGKYYYENDYDGYGVFGGMDYYELLDKMNGGIGDRSEGIRKAFDKPAVAAGEVKLYRLDDVDYNTVKTPSDGQALVWSESLGKWQANTVSGGGGGGGTDGNGGTGGGGAGGVRCTTGATGGGGSLESPLSLNANTNYTVTIGAGGNAGTNINSDATSGNNSVFSTITATGGGFGASGPSSGSARTGGNGGSGGGSSHWNFTGTRNGGTGTTNEGYAGGSVTGVGGNRSGGGGGGASAAGGNASGTTSGAGGNGITTSISGASSS